ncbi:hypothetical protein [Fibrella aquatica]|jgi:hypothetical protein|uniref:hypothetical protein n=1 Tax=Fibrella aquatica TaxID=3242487 RepID=UPI003521DEDE
MNIQLLPRWLAVLIGPELLWLLVYGVITWLIDVNGMPHVLIDLLIKCLPIGMPSVAGMAFFAWYIPDVEKRWLLLRVWIASLVGAHGSMQKALLAFTGKGAGLVYLAGMILVVLVLLVGSLFILIRFRRKSK